MEVARAPHITVPAVAWAASTEHPAPTGSTIAEVHVRPGDTVEAGAALVTLADTELRRQLRSLDLEMRVALEESQLGVLRQSTGEQGGDDALAQASARLHQTRITLLEAQRDDLQARIEGLEVRAAHSGIVASVLSPGAVVSRGVSVARLVPPHASEVVAYFPPETNPAVAPRVGEVLIAQSEGNTCAGELTRRVGAEVTTIPGETGPFGGPTYGLPVHIAVPTECQLGVGQRVRVSLEMP